MPGQSPDITQPSIHPFSARLEIRIRPGGWRWRQVVTGGCIEAVMRIFMAFFQLGIRGGDRHGGLGRMDGRGLFSLLFHLVAL